jgi:hypothetical protein
LSYDTTTTHAMIRTIHSMNVKVAEICKKGVVRTRILQMIFAAMFSQSYRNNFKRLYEVIGCTESTVHPMRNPINKNLSIHSKHNQYS